MILSFGCRYLCDDDFGGRGFPVPWGSLLAPCPLPTLAVLDDLNRRAGKTGERNQVQYDVWAALINGQLKNEPKVQEEKK